MSQLLECVPNFSEGRDQDTIDTIAGALRKPGVTLLDVQSDSDHNRSVFTLIGEAGPLIDAVFDAVKVAVERIDLRQHTGAHPRLGAADVVPFIPLMETPMEAAVSASRDLGQRVAQELALPVYFYEESATSPERQNLEKIRGKGFEELREAVLTDPSRKPDLGAAELHQSAGAVVIGARRPLIAYNIYLDTQKIAVARAIAKTIRHSTGGLRYVKALGFDIPERSCVQVSMNLTNHTRTAMHTVFEMVRDEASSYGVSISQSEVVGMVPAAALFDAARHYLRMHELSGDQVLEMRLLQQEPAP